MGWQIRYGLWEVRWETMDGEEMVKTRSQTDSEELRVAVQQAVWI